MNTQSRYKPKYKICSQANENIWGSTKVLKFNSAKWKTLKNNHEKQNSRDFFHDSIKVNTFARPLKQNFKNNLVAKQRLKRYYGKLPEYQFHKLIKQALKTSLQTRSSISPAEALANLLERRLETVIYRMNFATTIEHARQLVAHGHVLVNGKVVKTSSFLINDFDTISIKKNQLNSISKIIKANSNFKIVPPYLEVNFNILSGIFLGPVLLKDIPYATWMDFRGSLSFYQH